MEGKRHKRPARRKRDLSRTRNRRGKTGRRTLPRQRGSSTRGRFRKNTPAAPLPEHNLQRNVGDDIEKEPKACPGDMLSSERNANAAYEEGYNKGYYEGGEAKLSRQLPPHTVLPDMTLDDVIALGIQQAASSFVPILPPAAVYREIIQALDLRLPLSVIRLGDGELLTLAHDMIISAEQARHLGPFLPYAGVILPDGAARKSLADSLRQASIVGIPESRHPSFQGLLFPVLKQLCIPYHELRMTTSTVNYALHEQGLFYRMLRGRKLLLIGNKAAGLANVLSAHGLEVVGIATPVNGVHDVRRIIGQISDIDFDLALVAAGVAAVMICTAIARELGKVSFDTGHLANLLESGESLLLPGLGVNG